MERASGADEQRFAIYFVPVRQSALWHFGCGWLGRDAESGLLCAPPEGMDASFWRALVRKPQGYGFHATLKAPFRLAPDQSAEGLEEALSRFAASLEPMRPALQSLAPLELRQIGSFFALVPSEPVDAFDRLAAHAVQTFEPFRAPMNEAERTRRTPHRLSARQRDLLETYGYPYVLDEFRFHMTLTGPVKEDARSDVLALLQRFYDESGVCEESFFGEIALFAQNTGQDAFRLVRRFLPGTEDMHMR